MNKTNTIIKVLADTNPALSRNPDVVLVQPEDALIEIKVTSDVRQVGKIRLMTKIAEFLKKEGYMNVTASTGVEKNQLPDPDMYNYEGTKHQPWLNVNIQISDTDNEE